METLDLNVGPPRRWTQELGGIRWLPRLIDKARAALAGTLGSYLYGQSPMDRDLLNKLGLGYRDFTAIVASAPSDAAVLEALQARSPQGVERARIWSANLHRSHWFFLLIMDLDDGYVEGPARAIKGPVNSLSAKYTRWIKRRWPSRHISPQK